MKQFSLPYFVQVYFSVCHDSKAAVQREERAHHLKYTRNYNISIHPSPSVRLTEGCQARPGDVESSLEPNSWDLGERVH